MRIFTKSIANVSQNGIYYPGLRESLILAVSIFFYYLLQIYVLNFDSLLAWPITDKLAHPEYYAPGDLIIEAGTTGNFLLYRLLALIPVFQYNFPLRDFLIYIPIFLLYCLAWYSVFFEISRDSKVTVTALVVFIFSDAKLGLNWANAPYPYLVSYSSVHFLQIFALLFFFQRRYFASFIILALTGYFHPATSIVYFLIFSCVLLIKSMREKKYRDLLPLGVFGLCFLPNLVMFTLNSQGALAITKEYWAIVRNFQYHAYLEDHFREGYSYTIVLMGLLIITLRHHWGAKVRHLEVLILVMLFSLVGSVLWLLNLYVLHNIQFAQTFFITRAFYILKPLLILLIVIVAVDLVQRSNSFLAPFVYFLLVATTLMFSPILSLIITVSVPVYALSRMAGVALAGLLAGIFLVLASFEGMHWLFACLRVPPANVVLLWFELAMMFTVAPFVLTAIGHYYRKTGSNPVAQKGKTGLLYLLIMLAIIKIASAGIVRWSSASTSFTFSQERNFGIDRTDPEYNQLIEWAKTVKHKLFIVPPGEFRFLSFRYLTKNGIYAHELEVNQLMYSPVFYYEEFKRLKLLGLVVIGPKVMNWDDYNMLTPERIRSTNADFIIFDKRTFTNVNNFTIHPAFENNNYVVYFVKYFV